MTDADRKRLAAILGMLGSNSVGERDAAALQAEAFRRKHGLTWDELLSGETVTVYVDREVVVETAVDRPVPMPLVQSIVDAVGGQWPIWMFLLAVSATLISATARAILGV